MVFATRVLVRAGVVCLAMCAATPPVLADPSLCATGDPQEGATAAATQTTAELPGLLAAYFKADARRDRAKLAARISRLDGITVEAVARAVRRVELWEPRPAGTSGFVLDTPRDSGRPPHATTVHLSVPAGYEPTRAYPLLLALHGEGGNGKQFVRFARELLGDRADEFLIAAPTGYEGVWLGSAADAARDPVLVLEALKRRYHVDTDRVYITGYSRGGHASFVLAALQSDYFAASVPLGGTFTSEIGPEAVDVLLPNLRHIPILVVYGELDRTGAGDLPGPGGVARWNRYIAQRAASLRVPIRMVELKGVAHAGITPPAEDFREMLSRTRPHRIARLEHWFRYPGQGRLSWLRQTGFGGEPWTAQQIVVAPAPGESPSQAVTAILEDKLAYIGGDIDGQVIRVRTRRCTKLDLLLGNELVDLDRDMTIYLDDTKRFTGRATPKIATLLEVAHEDWDFQRLWPVRFRIGRKGRAVQY